MRVLNLIASFNSFILFYFLANGLLFSFDVKTTLNISDLTFYPSQTTHSYDIYATAQDKEDILFLNLLTGTIIFDFNKTFSSVLLRF